MLRLQVISLSLIIFSCKEIFVAQIKDILTLSITSPFHIPKTERRGFSGVPRIPKRQPYNVPDYMVDDYSASMNMDRRNPLDENPLRDDLFEGDIMINPLKGRTTINSASRKWPGGIVKYKINPSGFSFNQIIDIIYAMKHISEVSCIKFMEYSESKDKDYVSISSDANSCSSYLGRIGGMQKLLLRPSCGFGTAVHELLHAIGFVHEQTRADRDEWVKVYYENIKDGRKGDFAKNDASQLLTFGKRYDVHSIMHYGQSWASKNDKNTLGVTDKLVNLYREVFPIAREVPFNIYRLLLNDAMAKGDQMSYLDIEKLNLLYC